MLRACFICPSRQASLISGLRPSEFLEALALLGLSIFQSRRLVGAPSSPEQRLAAFFSHLGLRPPQVGLSPGLLPAGGARPAAAGGTALCGAGAGGYHAAARQQADPYAEWWGMRFDGPRADGPQSERPGTSQGPGGSGAYRSSQQYHLALLQVGALMLGITLAAKGHCGGL
jgi:hypothetical protein